ncbi:hypothetical protein [Trinickia dinghuensis]|uniref:Uncharacterized protein n=1 Tax=Trinickia dinghuensis TaxID=2291023 RepID=A0A3D8JXJ3_9BURK|nr:hypothetical protein [Trinickia dinghuensis]RDU97542.1 hypothetical protein DWV00_16790 [Trinickia dinghuensis]
MQGKKATTQPSVSHATEPQTHGVSMASERHAGLTQLAAAIDASPRMTAQRKKMGGLPVPRPGKKDKVPVQGKFDNALPQSAFDETSGL